MKTAACFVTTLIIALSTPSTAHSVEYPDMVGLWAGEVRTVSSGEQVSSQVARGGAVIETIHLEFTVSYQDGEVFIGESLRERQQHDAVG